MKIIFTGFSIFLILFLGSSTSKAQENSNVGGTITDASTGETLPGVNISVKGTTTGAASGTDGSYQLAVSSLTDTLVFSFVGYERQEVPINNRSIIDIAMNSQTITGEEMVVVGYGTQRKEDVTGSVSSVDSEDFVKGSVTDAGQLIQGKVAGLNIVTPDANPTSTSQINLRGVTTLLSNSDPLVLIDGGSGIAG